MPWNSRRREDVRSDSKLNFSLMLKYNSVISLVLSSSSPFRMIYQFISLTAGRSLVIDKLKLVRGPRTGIAFFYCDYRDMESHTTANIIASLLKQLCSSLEVLPQSVSRLYSESDMGQNTPKVEELRKVFLDVCRIFQDVYVIIDAVDECDGSKQRPTLLKTLDIIQKEAAKVFVTSRPYSDDIRRAFAQGPQIQINARTSDIRIYLEAKIHDNTAAEDIMDKRLMMEIVSVISEGASGM